MCSASTCGPCRKGRWCLYTGSLTTLSKHFTDRKHSYRYLECCKKWQLTWQLHSRGTCPSKHCTGSAHLPRCETNIISIIILIIIITVVISNRISIKHTLVLYVIADHYSCYNSSSNNSNYSNNICLSLTMKHVLVHHLNLWNFTTNTTTVLFLKNLFRITCNRAINDFIKETHFYNPVQNMCIVSVVSILSQLYCTVRVLHSLLPHLFNSFFIRSFTNNLQHWTACHVLMVKPRSQSLINSHNNDHDSQQWNVTIYAAQCTTYISLQNTNEQS